MQISYESPCAFFKTFLITSHFLYGTGLKLMASMLGQRLKIAMYSILIYTFPFFLQKAAVILPEQKEKRIRKLFELYDIDGNGEITQDEMAEMIYKYIFKKSTVHIVQVGPCCKKPTIHIVQIDYAKKIYSTYCRMPGKWGLH